MGSVDSPTTWVPSINIQDCSQKICIPSCPQWCYNYNYLFLPPPPPPPAEDDSGGAALSPLLIIIIGVFGSACLLISYYVIISRLCAVNNNHSTETFTRRRVQNEERLDLEIMEDDYNIEDDPLNLGSWLVPGKGLDGDMINSIRVCKYKKGDGLVSSTDCPVCLGEFQEDESLRLLPKCSHAFHVHCIDTWLTSHSNCPLCRANVSCVNSSPRISPPPLSAPPPPPPPPPPTPPPQTEVIMPRRVTSDLSGQEAVIEIRDEENERQVRRSVSMSYLCETRVSIADILFVDQEDDMESDICQFLDTGESSKHDLKSGECGDDMMRRSYSSGRYLFIRGGKGKMLRVSTSVPA